MARAKCGGGPASRDGQHIYSYPHPCTLPFVNLIRTFMRALAFGLALDFFGSFVPACILRLSQVFPMIFSTFYAANRKVSTYGVPLCTTANTLATILFLMIF